MLMILPTTLLLGVLGYLFYNSKKELSLDNHDLIERASSTKILIIFELLKLFSMLNLSIILITSSLGIKPTLLFLVGIKKNKVQHLTIISVALYSL